MNSSHINPQPQIAQKCLWTFLNEKICLMVRGIYRQNQWYSFKYYSLKNSRRAEMPHDKGNFISTALRAVIQSRYWSQSLAVISFIGKHVPKSLSEISFWKCVLRCTYSFSFLLFFIFQQGPCSAGCFFSILITDRILLRSGLVFS